MATTFQHLRVADLTKEELDAALECAKQADALRFRSQDDYEVCDDSKGLERASRKFIEIFAPWSKFGGKASKLQAFRFKKTAILPVSGSMLSIPTSSATISGTAVKVGSYVQLTEDVSIEPEVLCLVFRAW